MDDILSIQWSSGHMAIYMPAFFPCTAGKLNKLKKYIASGRWHVSGCCVDANDVMTTSAESIMRNWLYGTTFFQKEFGVRAGTISCCPIASDFLMPCRRLPAIAA